MLDGDTLRLVSLAGAGEPVGLVWGKTLISVDVEEAAERVAKSSRAYGWDPAMATGFSATAGIARQDQEIDLRSFGLGARELTMACSSFPTATRQAKKNRRTGAGRARPRGGRAVCCPRHRAGRTAAAPRRARDLGGLPDNDPLTVVVTAQPISSTAMPAIAPNSPARRPRAPSRRCTAPIVTLGIVTNIDDPRARAGAASTCRPLTVSMPAFEPW